MMITQTAPTIFPHGPDSAYYSIIVYYERVIPGTMGTFLSGDTQCFSRVSLLAQVLSGSLHGIYYGHYTSMVNVGGYKFPIELCLLVFHLLSSQEIVHGLPNYN